MGFKVGFDKKACGGISIQVQYSFFQLVKEIKIIKFCGQDVFDAARPSHPKLPSYVHHAHARNDDAPSLGFSPNSFQANRARLTLEGTKKASSKTRPRGIGCIISFELDDNDIFSIHRHSECLRLFHKISGILFSLFQITSGFSIYS